MGRGATPTDGDRGAFAESGASKLIENPTPRAHATANTREQVSNSPNPREGLPNVTIATMDTRGGMSGQAVSAEAALAGLLGPGALWRARKGEGPVGGA